ncbi:MAG TPA: hypothetical protein VFC19_02150 [Candidatus Limnocylindrales bacterium]|nr:hypothetical protein [Candidatus Limnocylindrales bacterium]
MIQRALSAVVAAMAAIFSVVACDPQPPAGPPVSGKPRPSQSPSGIAWQRRMTGPTGLRVLADGLLIDVDSSTMASRDVTDRLLPVNGPPIFLVRAGTEQVGAVRVERATLLAHPIFATWRPGDAQIAVRSPNPVPGETFKRGIASIFAW